MKAIVCTKYGSPDVLQLQEVAKPAPQDDEVLIRIHAASVNARDWRFMRAKPFFIRLAPGGLLGPRNRILGADVAGRVEAIGSNVRQYKPGDKVFGYLPTYSPWLNPIEMLWRHFRREVTHCELFETVKVLIEASYDFFRRYNQTPDKVLSIIGAHSS